MVGRVIEPFAFFLEFVGDETRRKALEVELLEIVAP